MYVRPDEVTIDKNTAIIPSQSKHRNRELYLLQGSCQTVAITRVVRTISVTCPKYANQEIEKNMRGRDNFFCRYLFDNQNKTLKPYFNDSNNTFPQPSSRKSMRRNKTSK